MVDGLAGQAEMVIDELNCEDRDQSSINQCRFSAAQLPMNYSPTYPRLRRMRSFLLTEFSKREKVAWVAKSGSLSGNDEVLTNSFVCAEVLTEKPFSIVARHGWKPMDGPYRVTRSQGSILHELSGRPAWGAYQKFAQKHGIDVPQGEEASFLMRYILGIEAEGEYKLRVPLALNSDGSFACAAEVLEGDVVYIMTSDEEAIMRGE